MDNAERKKILNLINTSVTPTTELSMEADEKAENAQDLAINANDNAAEAIEVANNTNQYFWHVEEGEYFQTEDTTVDSTKTYYEISEESEGDISYIPVTPVGNENPSELGWYEKFEDTGAHITEIPKEEFMPDPENGGGNLLARSNGIAVRDGLDELAQFSSNGAQIGQTGKSHAIVDYHSFQLIDKEGYEFFRIADLRNSDGVATIEDVFRGDGNSKIFHLSNPASAVPYTVTVNGQPVSVIYDVELFKLSVAPNVGAEIKAVYETTNQDAKSYTLGYRYGNDGVLSVAEGNGITASGNISHAEGDSTTASGSISHAEGARTTASGNASHSEGYDTGASGDYSHAQNEETIASCRAQTVLGTLNEMDTGAVHTHWGEDAPSYGQYAVIVGNGYYNWQSLRPEHRSNALTVDWQGRVELGNYSGTLTSIFDLFYPVGSYYETSDTSFDPNVQWGGTWSLETEGQVHVSAGTNYTVVGALTDTSDGGSDTHTHTTADHTLTVSEIPSHKHNLRERYNSGSSTTYAYMTESGKAEWGSSRVSSTGGGSPHNHGNTGSSSNMQPYIVVNRWHRTA